MNFTGGDGAARHRCEPSHGITLQHGVSTMHYDLPEEARGERRATGGEIINFVDRSVPAFGTRLQDITVIGMNHVDLPDEELTEF